MLCKSYKEGFCAKPQKKDLTLFCPHNNLNNHPHPNLTASHTGEGPSCINIKIDVSLFPTLLPILIIFLVSVASFIKFKITSCPLGFYSVHSNSNSHDILHRGNHLMIKKDLLQCRQKLPTLKALKLPFVNLNLVDISAILVRT